MAHTILVVDDTEANRYVLCRCLRLAGYDVIEAADGSHALELAWSRPDLVVLDINLPDIDGYEVCRRIKNDPATRGILVLNISASVTTSTARVTGLENGADSYLVQPMEPSEFLATVRSLLRLRDAERLAMRREARYKALVEASSQAVWALEANGAVIEEFGLGDLLGCPISRSAPDAWLGCFLPEDAERLRTGWNAALAQGTSWEETGRVHDDRGAVRHVHLRVIPWRDHGAERVVEWIGSAHDVTVMVEAERQLAVKVDELARSNQYLEHFAHVLSHDLQEPLRTITNYLDLIQKRAGQDFREKNSRYFSHVTEAAKRMRELITGVLKYSTITRIPERQRIELAEAVAEAIANLTPAIEAKAARVAYDPLPIALVDRIQIVQLFQNLISNSLKYCSDRPPEVRISCRTDGGFHRISIADNGIGMEAQHLDRVFELFTRLHSHEHYEGTGIGLALCRRIVEHHGGKIWAESTPGQGSVFTFTLPVAPA